MRLSKHKCNSNENLAIVLDAQVLYILSKGLVALNSRVRSIGVVWGEDFVLSDTSLIRPIACYALTYVELLSLTRDDFMQIIQRRRFTCPELFRIVRRYCVRIAVYRGILAEARRRQLEKIKAEVPAARFFPLPFLDSSNLRVLQAFPRSAATGGEGKGRGEECQTRRQGPCQVQSTEPASTSWSNR